MGRKKELEIKVKKARDDLDLLEFELWKLNTKEWCEKWLLENK